MKRVALIGIGGYGENYIKAFAENDVKSATLIAIVDPASGRSPYIDWIETKDIPVYCDLSSFLKSDASFDLAVISSPIHTHYSYIKELLTYGVDILVEKPVTIDIPRMEELIRLEKESRHFVAVGYQLCYEPSLLKMKEDILAGLYGKALRAKAIRLMRRDRKYYRRTSWAGRLRVGNEYIFDSPLSNACAHHAEAMLFLLGGSMEETLHVKSVTGNLWKGRPDIENFDAAAIEIDTTENIPLYYYTAHSVLSKKVGPDMEIEFEKGKIVGLDDNFMGVLNDGCVIDYTKTYGKADRLKKLYDSVSLAGGDGCPPVTLISSIEHVKAVLLVERLPVFISFDTEVVGEGDDETYVIPGLEDALKSGYETWTIPTLIPGESAPEPKKEKFHTRRSK